MTDVRQEIIAAYLQIAGRIRLLIEDWPEDPAEWHEFDEMVEMVATARDLYLYGQHEEAYGELPSS